MDRVKRIRYLSPKRAAKVQASESRGTFRQKARSLASLNGWTCAVTICHDGMLEDTNSLDGAHISILARRTVILIHRQILRVFLVVFPLMAAELLSAL